PGGRYGLANRKSERAGPEEPQERASGRPRATALADRLEVKGRLVLHHDGYGFVVPDAPMPHLDGDVFIPREAIEDAMHGDHVLAKIQRLGGVTGAQRAEGRITRIDRKSTRLNSSHVEISYAVFCLKKKKKASGTSIIF